MHSLLRWRHMNHRRTGSSPARLPNRLWQYRKRMGFTQQEVAAMLGYLSRAEISDFERGDKLPSFVSALKLEIVYRVPVAFLFPALYARLKVQLRDKEERLRPAKARSENETA